MDSCKVQEVSEGPRQFQLFVKHISKILPVAALWDYRQQTFLDRFRLITISSCIALKNVSPFKNPAREVHNLLKSGKRGRVFAEAFSGGAPITRAYYLSIKKVSTKV